MYNPHKLIENYEKLNNGKIQIEGIREAIKEADRQNDLSFQLFFRLELCKESVYYGDMMDLFVVFPEILALIDKHPNIEVTEYNCYFQNGTAHALWVYKWILEHCAEYPQIPLEDCKRFFEDFKKRSQAFGYNLKPYYAYMANLYQYMDEDMEEQYLKEYEKLPRDGNSDCAACDRNIEIAYYLKKEMCIRQRHCRKISRGSN